MLAIKAWVPEGATPERVHELTQSTIKHVNDITTEMEGTEGIAALVNALAASIEMAPENMQRGYVLVAIQTLAENCGGRVDVLSMGDTDPEVKH